MPLTFFLLFTATTLALTLVAARRTAGGADFYTAAHRVTPGQNALALAGDYLSAAAFLGAAGMYMSQGYDSMVYAVGTLLGWPLLMLLFAGRLRRLGRYTLADVLARRFPAPSLRAGSALVSLTITLFYLVVQMVGAGKLLGLLFGLSYGVAVLLVGSLMLACVAAGGMLATTWVQMVKAVLLFACALLLAALALARSGGPAALFDAVAHKAGAAAFLPGPALSSPVEVMSLGLGLTLGLLGLPHVLTRFFTVPDARAARRSAALASVLIALFFTLNAVIGYGALLWVDGNPAYLDAGGRLAGGGNMAALHLAHVLGGDPLRALVAAVAFATILAVVSGLAISGAGVLAHDVYAGLLRRGRVSDRGLLTASRLATLALGACAMALSLALQDFNIAFLMGLAFAIAASSNFPVLLLTLFWPGLSARGALACGATGLVAALALILTGPAVWTGVLGLPHPPFPWSNPTFAALPLALLAGWLGSRLWPDS